MLQPVTGLFPVQSRTEATVLEAAKLHDAALPQVIHGSVALLQEYAYVVKRPFVAKRAAVSLWDKQITHRGRYFFVVPSEASVQVVSARVSHALILATPGDVSIVNPLLFMLVGSELRYCQHLGSELV